MPQRTLLVLGGLVIATIPPFAQLNAAQEPVMRVLVLEAKQLRLRADGDHPLLVRGISGGNKRVSTLKIRKKNGQYIVAINGSKNIWSYLPRSKGLRVRSKDPRGIWLGKRRYSGELRVLIKGDGLKVVNHLGIEKYLASVVGSEMPKSWPIAALKAQAIASRTYALQQLDKKNFYDVSATEKNQVYLGIESETQRIRAAVENTRSLVLTHQGRLINAVFHSSSGGKTEASGAVWKRQLPYLVSVLDFDQHSPSYQWKMTFPPDHLEMVFSETGGLDSIRVLRSSETGRILEVRIEGPSGNLNLNGAELRQRLGLKSTLANFALIPFKSHKPLLKKKYPNMTPSLFGSEETLSRNKSLARTLIRSRSSKELVADIPLQPLPPLPQSSTFDDLEDSLPPFPSPPSSLPPLSKKYILVVRGSGSGHGAGMSQWGAHGLAKKGVGFRRILTHYYKGVEIRYFSSI